jgi:putative acetyltransferase
MIIIRAETIEDQAEVRVVNESAFGRPNEADLIDALRANAVPFISLVAIVDYKVVGHIFFSPVTIESKETTFVGMGLAPMAVLPDRQNQGVGGALVREGLEECRRRGYDIVVVLGHSKYYPRFGFERASAKGLRCEYDVADEVFMLAELRPGALAGRQGLVKYHPEFARV